MTTLLFAGHQLRLQLRSPGILALFIVGPLFIIFVFGQAFTAIFAAGNQGFSAMQYFGVTLLTMAVFLRCSGPPGAGVYTVTHGPPRSPPPAC